MEPPHGVVERPEPVAAVARDVQRAKDGLGPISTEGDRVGGVLSQPKLDRVGHGPSSYGAFGARLVRRFDPQALRHPRRRSLVEWVALARDFEHDLHSPETISPWWRRCGPQRFFTCGRSRIGSVEVKLGKRVVKDVVQGDLLEVEVDLEAEGLAWPDNEWLGLFRGYRDFPADLEEPRLEYGKLHFEASDEDLQRAWSALKERVAATNRSYGELLAPRRGVEQRAEDERRTDVRKRIEDAQRQLDSLD